jgi:PKD repeat protein
MDYGDDAQDGSGAWVIQAEAGGPARPCAEYAFRHYWAYDTTTLQGLSEANYSSAQWIALLEADLNAGRPIQYEGDDIGGGGGHSWVCDGYDANDMMHMNWGWSGSNDGYFAINALTAGGYNFSADEGALIGIQPPPVFQVLASAASGTVCHGGLTQITATGPASATYSWTPTTGLACATCATTTATPTATTAYSVTVDSAGIQVQNSVLVTVAPGITAGFIAPTARSCSAPAYISFTNTSQYAATYVWDFGDGTQGTDTTPYHTYTSYGTYTVKLTATGACGVDSVTKAQYISVIDITPTASGASVCHGTSATLTATTPAGTSILWSDSLGDVVDTNAVFHTPAITVNTNYYLQSSIAGATQYAGPATDAFGTGGNFASQNGHSVIFDCHSPQTLVSVDVYAQGDAVRTIEVLDAAGDVYDSISIDIPDGHSTVPLHFYLPAQTGLMLNAGGNINLYRNQTGANYPYYSADSSVVLTGSDAGPAYYYFFYHWRLQALACTSDPVPVTVSVMNGAATFTTQATALAVSFTPTVTTASSYQWSFGDGATSTDQNPSHTYATSGTYTVQLIESNGSCTDTLSQQIAAYATGITSLTALQNMTVYPNPAHDRLSVSVGASQPTACQLIITDMIGQTVSDRAVQLTGGSNTFTEAVATYAPGVYTVTLMSGDAKVTGRFIKE